MKTEASAVKSHIIHIIYYVVPLLLFVYCCKTIINDSIWVDESFSLAMIKHSYREMIEYTAMDVHPPLYYIIYKAGYALFAPIFSYNAIWVGKFISIIPLFLHLVLGYCVVSKMFNRQTAFIFNLSVITMPQMLLFGIEIRMYSWAMFFITSCLLLAMRLIQSDGAGKKKWIGFTLFAILASYTHYFACVSAVVIYGFLILYALIKRRFSFVKNTIFSGLAVVLSYLPWIFVVIGQIKQVKSDYWIGDITFDTLLEYIKFLFKTNAGTYFSWLLFLLVVLCLVVFIAQIKKPGKEYALFALLIVPCTVLIGLIASLLIRPVFVSRYMGPSMGCMWLAFSIIIGMYLKKIAYLLYLAVFFLCGIMNLKYTLSSETQLHQAYSSFLSDIEAEVSPDSLIIQTYAHTNLCMAVYFPELNNIVYQHENSPVVDDVFSDSNIGELENIQELNTIDKDIWIMVCNNQIQILDDLTQAGYEYELKGQYDLAWHIDLYKVSR